MLLFAISILLLLISALWLILTGLHENPDVESIQNDKKLLSLYRLREEELQQSLKEGDIDQAAYDESLQNYQKQLLADTDSETTSSNMSNDTNDERPKILGYGIGVLVPVLSIALYLYLGGGEQSLAFKIPTVAEISDAPDKMLEMMEQAFDPETASAAEWALLGRTYNANSEFDKAQQAFSQAMQMEPDTIAYLSDFIEASMLKNDGKPVAGIKELITLGLSRSENAKLLWLAAVVASYENDTAAQQDFLQRLLLKIQPDDPSRPRIEALLAQLGATDDNKTSVEESSAAEIAVNVTLDASLEGHLNEQSTLFVFAKAPQGPPMPIAVARYRWSEAPERIVLNDSLSMMPTRKLSQFESVDITAQISQTGQANANPGDLRGVVKAVSVGEAVELSILINELIE